MGKPAARILDMTAHGGMITGPGCPTVLIGKMPAARIADMHMCPMCNGPVPHVGGPIIGPVPPTVFIGKMPAACVGDMCICVGPPATILPPGCPTVLIGSAGGGGGGGGGGGASSAGSAQTEKGKSPDKATGGSARAFETALAELGEDPETSDHYHKLDLALFGEGYKEQESKDEEASCTIENAGWNRKRIWFGEEVELKIMTKNMEEGTGLKVQIFERDESNPDDFVFEKEIDSTGDETVFSWKADFDTTNIYEDDEGDDFELFAIIKVEKTKTAKSFRDNLLYVDVPRLRFGV